MNELISLDPIFFVICQEKKKVLPHPYNCQEDWTDQRELALST